MKRTFITTALGLLAAALWAAPAPITPVEVGAPAIDCLYNPACTNLVEDTATPILLPGTTGTGFVQSRVIRGESGSPAEGLFGYEYRIDLTGVSLGTNAPPCFTNVVRYTTNRVQVVTNVVVCPTNGPATTNQLVCVTNRAPATNIVIGITNYAAGTNFQQCFTNAFGAVTCFTNDFPATNYVRWITNRVPAWAVTVCQTNIIPLTNGLTGCRTNQVRYTTNLVTAVTNVVPCSGSSPCIQELRINFGPIASRLDFDANGSSTDQVYVVTSDALGGTAPAQITQSNRQVILQFSPPLCPGDSSFFVGLLSASPPRNVAARLQIAGGSTLAVAVRAPRVARLGNCDFSSLLSSLNRLSSRDILGPNAQARESHRNALLAQVNVAELAAKARNLDAMLTALAGIMVHTDGGNNDWVTPSAARAINHALADLIDCAERTAGSLPQQGRHDDGDDDDDDESHDGQHRH